MLDAGVVDQNVERHAAPVKAGERRLYRRLVCHIKRCTFGIQAKGLQARYCRIHHIRLAAVDDDAGSGLGQTLGQCETNAAGRPGDQGGAATEVEKRRRGA